MTKQLGFSSRWTLTLLAAAFAGGCADGAAPEPPSLTGTAPPGSSAVHERALQVPPPPVEVTEGEIRSRIAASSAAAAALQRRSPHEQLRDLIAGARAESGRSHGARQITLASARRLIERLPATERAAAISRVGTAVGDPRWLGEPDGAVRSTEVSR